MIGALMRWRRLAVIALIGVAIAVVPAVPTTRAAALSPMTIATFSGEVYGLDVIADRQGFFRQHGLDVKFLSPPSGGAAAAQFLVGGSIAGWSTNPEILFLAAAKGEGVRFAGMLNDWIPYAIQVPQNSPLAKVAADPRASFKDRMEALRGKTLGLTGIGALVYLALQAGLQLAGVPVDAVHIIAVGPPQSGIAQLNSGRLDGYVTYSQADAGVMAIEAHTVQYVSLTGAGAPEQIRSLSTFAMGTSTRYATEHPDDVKSWVSALIDAFDWEKAHPVAAAQLVANADYGGKYVSVVASAVQHQITTAQDPRFHVSRRQFDEEIALLQTLGVLKRNDIMRNHIDYTSLVLPYAQAARR
jgi:ABC-type nitrate/sulfonate/bicarbonate transport system substrate-binding protein